MPGLTVMPAKALRGAVRAPGDKSISHRALLLSALAVGRSEIEGLLEGEDVLCTAAALGAYGATLTRQQAGRWSIDGIGVGGLLQPRNVLDMGNSGTAARLLMGLAASHGITSVFTGDASLRARPMTRVTEPLGGFGARFSASQDGRMPITVEGRDPAIPIDYRLPIASAQVKSAILLAGLNALGETRVIEPVPTRDHSETMLRHFGADLSIAANHAGEAVIAVRGPAELRPQAIAVPGDISSAAFLLVAGLLVPGSDLTVRGVGLNPRRTGLLQCLREMGAEISIAGETDRAGEPVGDLRVRHGRLRAIEVPPERAPAMIDEYPILCIAAAAARGTTTMRGIGELRVKESDRIAMMARGLRQMGVAVEEFADGLAVTGRDGVLPADPAARIATSLDHRIAMAFLVHGLAADASVTIDDARPIDSSFPGFVALLESLGAGFETIDEAA